MTGYKNWKITLNLSIIFLFNVHTHSHEALFHSVKSRVGCECEHWVVIVFYRKILLRNDSFIKCTKKRFLVFEYLKNYWKRTREKESLRNVCIVHLERWVQSIWKANSCGKSFNYIEIVWFYISDSTALKTHN